MKKLIVFLCFLMAVTSLMANTNIVKEVISLQKAQVSEQVMKSYVEGQWYLQVSYVELIELKTNGVPDSISILLTTNRLPTITIPYVESEEFFREKYLIPRANRESRKLTGT